MLLFQLLQYLTLIFYFGLAALQEPGLAMEEGRLMQERPRLKPLDFDRFEVRDWGALGSGCRGGGAGVGNITVKVFHDLASSHRYRFLIQTQDYGLDSDRPLAPNLANFARECAIRFAIYPEPGFEIVDVSAHTGFEIEKKKDVEVRLKSVLTIGDHMIQPWTVQIPKNSSGRWLKTVQHFSQDVDRKEMRSLGCEEPFLLGLDLSMATFRSNPKKEVQVRMKDRQAEIILEMGECQKRQVAKSSSTPANERKPL